MDGARAFAFLATTAAATALATPLLYNSTTVEYGYVPEPKGRGTVGILWSCLTTFLLSVWTAMHPNITPNATLSDRVLHKFFWAIITVLFPELILLRSCSQWMEAIELRRMWCEKFHVNPGEEGDLIGIEGAYFVLMGGFIAPRSHETAQYTTTLTSEGFKWGIQNDLLPQDVFRKQDIVDKGKANNIAKLIVCIQAGWMLVQVLGRLAARLPVTLLEVHVSIQVLIAVVLYTLWWSKPLDVDQPIELPPLAPYASDIETAKFYIAKAENEPQNTDKMPLGSYVTEKHRTGAAYMFCRVIFDLATAMLALPGQKQLSIGLPAILISIYGALHITAWNAHFPTLVECWLWRMTCVGMLCAGGILVLPFRVLGQTGNEVVLALWRLRLRAGSGNFGNAIWSVFLELRHEVAKDTPQFLKFDFSMCSLLVYLMAMIFLTVESIVSLRQLPVDAYKTPTWTGLWPHI